MICIFNTSLTFLICNINPLGSSINNVLNTKLNYIIMRNWLLFSTLFIFTSGVFSQDFQGVAIYQAKMKLDIELDSTKIPKEQHDAIREMIRKQSEKTYELSFSKTTSIYKEEEKLATPGKGSGGMVLGGSSDDILYKDTKDKVFVNQTELFGKGFLIKDSLSVFDWKMENETKMIGAHLCFKATTQKQISATKMRSFGQKKSEIEKEKSKSDKLETITVTAWYTPEIPVNNGPKEYWGLPGLILELNADKLQLLCTKIVLNPKDKKPIVAPDKGKEVSQNEYDEIRIKKIKEMKEMYGGKRGKGGRGHMIEIMR